jgi:hypothetical protein
MPIQKEETPGGWGVMRRRARTVKALVERLRVWSKIYGNGLTYRLLLDGAAKESPAPRQAIARSLDWLLEAHRAAAGKGFATHYSLAAAWGPPYPETSGYLIPTLQMARAVEHRRAELEDALERTGRWLLDIQYPDGAFDAPGTGQPMVFDTGQVLFGLVALSRGPRGGPYLEAARRAGDWLLAQQDAAGCWIRFAYRGIPHTYYSRVAWALAVLSEATGIGRYADAARRQLAWVKGRQATDGWFANCSFHADDRPVLHVIAYTIEGLWEAALLLGDADLEEGATKAAEALIGLEGGRGRLASHFGPGWTSSGRSVCVTGIAQTSLVWLRMARRYGRPEFAEAAGRCLRYLLRHQVEARGRPEIHGGMPGSLPLWGEYFPWGFPNWGAKFLIDALLVQEGVTNDSRSPG